MADLYRKLLENSESGRYPYHMPGHKRHPVGEMPDELYRIDITEIDGFDNLHQPEEILLELEKHAASIYGADRSYYLVNGSTSGILTAVSASVSFGGTLLMARNCHKSAYHAAYLRHLNVHYLMPEMISDYDIFDAVTPEQVEQALKQYPDVQAVLIVSPTYEGRIADVKEIARVVHGRGIPLIVDEAHGAHLGFYEGFAQNSCTCGADLVIHSVHKTLPCFTQTALLHLNGDLVNREKVEKYLRIYQTSSPSYILMAGIENGLEYVTTHREEFGYFADRFHLMMDKLSACTNLRFLPVSDNQDIGKLYICVKGTDWTGKMLYETMLTEYGLQPEMATESAVLAMFTIGDTQEAYERMECALLEIDRRIHTNGKKISESSTGDVGTEGQEKEESLEKNFDVKLPQVRRQLYQAWEESGEWHPARTCVGRTSAEFVNLYPPGVPILVPGEVITDRLISQIERLHKKGFSIQGITGRQDVLYMCVSRL